MGTSTDRIKDLRKQLRELRADMKRAGIRKISCFNGGLSRDEYYYNSMLFRLTTEIQRAERDQDK